MFNLKPIKPQMSFCSQIGTQSLVIEKLADPTLSMMGAMDQGHFSTRFTGDCGA